ncbi:dipeptide epimerase [Sphingopyxis lindanitolerans]|uniref:Dipeptide epimerase n=1 Tax=Sphingopyxis lindanitolerans TaxID=2054227 RepID=A0A2S8B151_9SPHN|nr:N-acetyl-D-Glu racemase DgcA [Sphingopyxis lindanitolerans]PQM26038.1 dipeptide epimerase [Sphingopyxis lindanitolerans]
MTAPPARPETPSLHVFAENIPLREPFRISRVEFHHSQVMVAEIAAGGHVGRGECEPHESDPLLRDRAMMALWALSNRVAEGVNRTDLAALLPAGPIRNALDCALWDLEAKQSGRTAASIAGVAVPIALPTVFTLGIDAPAAMAEKARRMAAWTRLKIKLGGDGTARDLDRVAAVRGARPDVELIVDANGGWTMAVLQHMAPALAGLGVALIEQPLPPGQDASLADYGSPVPLCADESCLDRRSLPAVIGRYAYINIKLDKTGGLTEALALADAAEAAGLGIMVGCMTGTSLAMAPAHLLAQRARFIDLDGPLLIAWDRSPGMRYEDGMVYPPQSALWG